MFVDDLLEGQVILVTGGGTGLGKSMAHRFAELGAHVAICGRRGDVAEDAAREIAEATGQETYARSTDVRDFEQVEALVDAVVERFGRITGLVNNAAGNFLVQTENLSPNGFKTIVDIVLRGSFHATLACGRKMIEQEDGGTILSIATTYAWTGSAFVVPSAAAKAGVLAMTRSRGVGTLRHSLERHRPGPLPHRGGVLPPHAGGALGTGEAKDPPAPLRRAPRAGQPGRLSHELRQRLRQRRGGDHRRR